MCFYIAMRKPAIIIHCQQHICSHSWYTPEMMYLDGIAFETFLGLILFVDWYIPGWLTYTRSILIFNMGLFLQPHHWVTPIIEMSLLTVNFFTSLFLSSYQSGSCSLLLVCCLLIEDPANQALIIFFTIISWSVNHYQSLSIAIEHYWQTTGHY